MLISWCQLLCFSELLTHEDTPQMILDQLSLPCDYGHEEREESKDGGDLCWLPECNEFVAQWVRFLELAWRLKKSHKDTSEIGVIFTKV